MAKLKKIDEAIDEVIEYIEGRMHGYITSLRTGYKKLDSAMIDGIEWNSVLTIGGRPSVGKSAYSDCIVDGCFANNLDKDGKPNFMLLDFNWELSSRVTLLRRLSARFKKTYKYIISADNNRINKREFEDMVKILRNQYGTLPITFCEEPLTIKDFVETIEDFCKENPGKRVLIRVDHTLLTKMSAGDSQVQMLLNLLMAANMLKKKLPVAFIFLTQINREFEERQEDGNDKSFPRQGDVYGGDAAAMFSETILLLNKPSKYNIRQYGMRGGLINFPIEGDDLFAHIVKNRNGENDIILHYKENFKNMSIKEY